MQTTSVELGVALVLLFGSLVSQLGYTTDLLAVASALDRPLFTMTTRGRRLCEYAF